MRRFRITINGKTTYEAEVEEIKSEIKRTENAPNPQPAAEQTVPAAPQPEEQPQVQAAEASAAAVTSPMPGTILDVKVKEGDEVKKGQVLMILEAMKMENEILAAEDGKIKNVYVQKGASVNTGDPLVELA